MQQPNARPPSSLIFHCNYGMPVDGVQDISDAMDLTGRADFELRVVNVTIGRGTTEDDFEEVLNLLKDDAFVLNMGWLSVTIELNAWSSDRETRIQQHFPSNVPTTFTIYDSDRKIQRTVTHINGDSQDLTFSLPIDVVQLSEGIDVMDVFRHPGLVALILLPPLNPTAFLHHAQGYQEQLMCLLQATKRLRKVRVPLDFYDGIKEIISTLKDIDSLRSLELTSPSSFNISNFPPTQGIQLENAMLTTLEPFPQLEELAFEKDILSDLILEMAERMFGKKEDSADGQSVIFREPHRDFVHNTPSFLL